MAVINTFVQDAVDLAEPLTLDAAHTRSCQAALTAADVGTVGLEIEAHLVDLRAVAEAVPWPRVEQVTESVRAVVQRSAVTVEPGGQLELSGQPEADIVAAVRGLRHDWQGVRLALAAWLRYGHDVSPPGELGQARPAGMRPGAGSRPDPASATQRRGSGCSLGSFRHVRAGGLRARACR